MHRLTTLVLTIGVLLSSHAWAGQQAPQTAERPVLHALHLNRDERIAVDGRLDEGVWSRAEPAAGFRQFEPKNGEPATERTEVRVLFDEDNLYIGGWLFDSNPQGLLGNQMVRDGALDADDRFIFVLDPFNDLRSGYYFEVNPVGAMGDAQLVPAQGGSAGVSQNRAWDGIWLARVQRSETGWTVEVRIPFRTLNFDPRGRTWGANFQRTIRRKNEETFWSGWGRNQGIYRLGSAGLIDGISDVSQGHGLDVKPYLIGTYGQVPASRPALYKKNAGIDFFYSLTPQLKANVTFNTDFAQTEVDDRQVNLTRFPLFFPEKRDFFLDGAGNFDFSREAPVNISAFFSRRIGLDDETGLPQKIDYGVKLGGRAGEYNLGLMHVQTATDTGTPGEEFTVFRPRRLLFRQSYAGLIYTRRAARDGSVPVRQSIGADFQLSTSTFKGDENLMLSGFYLKTPNPASPGRDAAWGLRMDFPNDRWDGQLGYKYFEQNFDPAMGFAQQTDYRKWTPSLSFNPRPRNSRWVRQFTFTARGELFTTLAGRWSQRTVTLTPLRMTFHSGDDILVQMESDYDLLKEDFRIRTGSGTITLPKNSDYQFNRYTFRVNTANRRRLSGTVSAAVGDFYSGTRRDLSATLNLRPYRGILATLSSTFNRVELPEGAFSTKLLRGIVNTQFSPFVSLSQNIQFDSVSHILGWQTRFRWIVQPGNDLYIVWLSNWIDAGDRLATLDRSAAAKLVYTYRF